jgi:hypothetical protein
VTGARTAFTLENRLAFQREESWHTFVCRLRLRSGLRDHGDAARVDDSPRSDVALRPKKLEMRRKVRDGLFQATRLEAAHGGEKDEGMGSSEDAR